MNRDTGGVKGKESLFVYESLSNLVGLWHLSQRNYKTMGDWGLLVLILLNRVSSYFLLTTLSYLLMA